MQTVVQVICTSGPSLRTLIGDQGKKLGTHSLEVVAEKADRNPGWMKIKDTSPGSHGALNVSWDGDTMTLTGRVVTRGAGKPNQIIAAFVSFLLRYHGKRVKLISIFEV